MERSQEGRAARPIAFAGRGRRIWGFLPCRRSARQARYNHSNEQFMYQNAIQEIACREKVFPKRGVQPSIRREEKRQQRRIAIRLPRVRTVTKSTRTQTRQIRPLRGGRGWETNSPRLRRYPQGPLAVFPSATDGFKTNCAASLNTR